jgi:methyl-accepting chemotaxis protein
MVAFGAVDMLDISGTASNIIEKRDLAVTNAIRATRNMLQASYFVYGSLLYDGQSEAGRAAEQGFPVAVKDAVDFLDAAARLAPDKAADFAGFKDRFQTLMNQAQRPLQMGQETPGLDHGRQITPDELDKIADATRLMVQVDVGTRKLISDIAEYNDKSLAENARAAADLRTQSMDALYAMIGVGLVAVLLSSAFALWMASSKIARPLTRLAEMMRSLAQGDLTVGIEGQERRDEVGVMAKAVQVFKDNAVALGAAEIAKFRLAGQSEEERRRSEAARVQTQREQAHVVQFIATGLEGLSGGNLMFRIAEPFAPEYEKLRTDFNFAVERLQDTMKVVSANAANIKSGTTEIASASDDLSKRTEQQAANLEQTAAALDQITATVRKTAKSSGHAQSLVGAAKKDAEASSHIVCEAVKAMNGIERSSSQIGTIISVIDEIAFQTNLLALNAGVEAARAGEAGRGFAVVASEVRALAQRSAEAAKEIKDLILASSTQVEQGVRLVGGTGQALERIVAQVTEISSIVIDIAASAQEQATALDQVNTAVNHMDQVTQQNAAMVEQTTAASRTLAKETSELAQLIGTFKVGQQGDRPEAIERRSGPAPRPAENTAPRIGLTSVGRGGAVRQAG